MIQFFKSLVKLKLADIIKTKYGPFCSLSTLPKLATPGAAGYDLVSAESLTVFRGQTVLVKTTFDWEIPKGIVGLVCSRSGLALKHSVFVLNAPGIVDSDYRGNVGVILHNAGKQDFVINEGDRIAQMVLVNHKTVKFIRTDSLADSERGSGGFGSTGK